MYPNDFSIPPMPGWPVGLAGGRFIDTPDPLLPDSIELFLLSFLGLVDRYNCLTKVASVFALKIETPVALQVTNLHRQPTHFLCSQFFREGLSFYNSVSLLF